MSTYRPQVFHRLWLGPEPMPERYRRYGRAWEQMNPGWTVRDWTAPPPLLNQDIYDRVGLGANAGVPMPAMQAVAVQRADVAAYELVYQFGGVYLNCDIEPVRPIQPLLDSIPDGAAFAGMEDDTYVCNAVLGGPARHPFWLAVIGALPERYNGMPGAQMNETTGPHLLTRMWQLHPTWLHVLPRETFFAIHHGVVPAGGTAEHLFDAAEHPDAIARHDWGHRLTATL